MKKRKICVVTGTRSEYGLLYWIMKELDKDSNIELQLVVTGMHLSPEFGLTYKQIELDGFIINEKVEMLLSADTPSAIAKSLGLGTIGFAEVFSKLQPDLLVILGDRFETLAAAQTAMIHRIPIAHIHGGEVTEGAIDEAIRHSISKMSQIHFVATEEYRKRVIQMGENPERVFNVGSPGLDHAEKIKLMTKVELEKSLNITLDNPLFLVTYHPVTLEKESSGKSINELLKALDYFSEATIIFTKANSDTNGRVINERLEEYVEKNKQRCKLYTSLGQLRYLSTIAHCDVVIGNSSSGLIEVPFFKKPTVNIGERQKGRIKASSIIDCVEEENAIKNSIDKALSLEFKEVLVQTESKYGSANASGKIVNIIKEIPLKEMVKKSFFDIEVPL